MLLIFEGKDDIPLSYISFFILKHRIPGVMCSQRRNNILMMRNMRRPAYPIYVYRNQRWGLTTSDMLVPGDIISLTSTHISAQGISVQMKFITIPY